MKKKELLRTVKFVLISASAGLIQAGSFTFCELVLKLDGTLCSLIALVLSVLWNFTINRRYTFQASQHLVRDMLLVAAFYLVFTPASLALFDYLTKQLLWHDFIVEGITMLLNLVLEFFYQRFVVYRKSVDTRQNAK